MPKPNKTYPLLPFRGIKKSKNKNIKAMKAFQKILNYINYYQLDTKNTF